MKSGWNQFLLYKPFVLDSMRLIVSKTLLLVLLIFAETALKPESLRITFKGKYVSADAIKEPAIV
jgi:hypothetical protein